MKFLAARLHYNMSINTMPIDQDLAYIQAKLNSHQNNVIYGIKGMQKSIDDLAVHITQLQLKSHRKDMVIKGLQGTLRKIVKDKKMLEKKFGLAEMDGGYTEIDVLRKENKALKDKLKDKRRKIRQYKLHLADVIDDEYEEDQDEEDGEPSEDSTGAENITDIEMGDPKTLLEESDSDTDSDFVIEEEDDKKAVVKAERKARAEEEIETKGVEEGNMKNEEAEAAKSDIEETKEGKMNDDGAGAGAGARAEDDEMKAESVQELIDE